MGNVQMLAGLGVLWFCSLSLAEEPGKPTADQQEKIKQLKQLLAEAPQLQAVGQVAKAIVSAEKALALERELLGKEHLLIADLLRFLGRLHEEREDFAAARTVRAEAAAMLTRLVGKGHWKVADAGRELADGERLAGLAAEERQQLRQAAALSQRVKRMYSQGQYREALDAAREVVAIRGKLLGESHPVYATSLHNLAFLYQSMGDSARALPLYEQARALTRKALGESHPAYATSLNNLAALYESRSDYAKALPLLEQARALNKQVLGESHPGYALSLNNLAALYQALGDHAKALPLFEQARALRKQVLGENHPDYATSLNSLAVLYWSMGDYAKALPLCEQARALRQQALGESHPDYALSLNNLAMLYRSMGDYARALPLLEQTCALVKKTQGESHPDYATSLHNLAALYRSMGDHARALPLFEQARALRKQALGESHPDYVASLNDLAVLNLRMGNHATAQRLSRQALEGSLQLLQDTLDVVGERQRLERFNSLRVFTNNFILSAGETGLPAGEVYAAILKWKGAVAFRQSADLLLRQQPDLEPILKDLHSVRSQLARCAFETPGPAQRDAWLHRLGQLRDDKEKLEAQLADASKTFRNLRRPAPSVAELRQALPKRTALLDFVVYRAWVPPPKRKDSKEEWQHHLAVFVVRPDQDVQLVFVDDLKTIETVIEAWRQAVTNNHVAAQTKAAALLHQRLWQPLQKHLGPADTVLICPDGPLMRLPFAAMPGKQPGTFLIEDLAIGYVASGRHIVDLLQPPDDGRAPPAGFLGLGGVDYGTSGKRPQAFEPLPGTGPEAARVEEQFRRRFPGQRSTLLLGDQPTRPKVLAEINQRYRYLHLATHGFFDSPARIAAMMAGLRASEVGLSPAQRSQRDDILGYLPLLKAGLVLAGANRGEGLLTAEDLSALDLRGCELVVLSACETSLGNLTQGDGVLGLQRGFHAGGARTLVTSLWSVHDAATSVLMEEFYTNLWRRDKPLGKLEALRLAQLFVLRNPGRVLERTKELQAQLAKRGLSADGLRGPKGDAVEILDEGKTEPGKRRSPAAWWAAFVLSGDPN